MGQDRYIGISDNKLKHMRSVAEECYRLGRESGLSEDDARTAYLMGFIHDIGYAFSAKAGDHPATGAGMLENLSGDTLDVVAYAIRYHGKPVHADGRKSVYAGLLNRADVTVMPDGRKVDAAERIADIASRYGEGSTQARNTRQLAENLGLIQAPAGPGCERIS